MPRQVDGRPEPSTEGRECSQMFTVTKRFSDGLRIAVCIGQHEARTACCRTAERPLGSGGLRGPAIREGEHRLRVEPADGAEKLPSEHFEAMQPAAFLASKVEVERLPVSVRIA